MASIVEQKAKGNYSSVIIKKTADGKIKNCLFSSEETDLLTALRSGENILPLIEDSIFKKHKELGGQFSNDFEKIETSWGSLMEFVFQYGWEETARIQRFPWMTQMQHTTLVYILSSFK